MDAKNVVFVILLKLLIIVLLAALLQNIIWRMVYLSYSIPPPANITNMFGKWLNGVRKNDKENFRIGISALCWSIWRTRNDIVFDKQIGTNFCRLSGVLLIEFNNGVSFSRQSNGRIWLLDATRC
jgi:hypothetical protein